MRFRNNCKNPKLRNIYFRLTHNDFYTKERMKRFKMINSEECSRCGYKENLEHLMWGCHQSRRIWSYYNELMTNTKNPSEKMLQYKDIFTTPQKSSITLIKIRIIQELIQIERPTNWSRETFNDKIKEIVRIEKYNFTVRKEETKFNIKWGNIENLDI